MTERYDVLVLGAGNAGLSAAYVTRAAGLSVAIVESREVGGTCPLRGCVPKKVLVAAAEVLHQIALAPVHQITTGPTRLDWGKLIVRERSFVEGVPAALEKDLAHRGIALYHGRARFVDRNRVTVDSTTMEASKIVIATGSKPRALPIPGAEHLITSEDILQMRALPESLVFIGGGVIALEFSHVFARAGCEVTIIGMTDRLLPPMDADPVAVISGETKRIGIALHTGATVEGVEAEGDRLVVQARIKDEPRRFVAERVANGAGRIANVDDLDLDAAGIEHEGVKIAVDAHLRSRSNPAVYVAGDALWSAPQLSPVATYHGELVGENIVKGDLRTAEHDSIPANVYTVPALASVGLTEAAAKAAGRDFEVKRHDMTGWRTARTHAETAAFAKVIVENGTRRILGAHMVGHGGEEIIHLFAFAMKHGVTADQLASTVYAYPTFSSDLRSIL
jgi:glutathione reductase (NADPH)